MSETESDQPLTWDVPEFGMGLGWGEWEPERREPHAPGGNYEGVGDDNPYAT